MNALSSLYMHLSLYEVFSNMIISSIRSFIPDTVLLSYAFWRNLEFLDNLTKTHYYMFI